MDQDLTPSQACDIVLATTGYHLDPGTLRQWRNRGLFHGYSREDGSGWTRYSDTDVFEICFMAAAVKAGYPARTAANIGRFGRNYTPELGLEVPNRFMVLPGIFGGDVDDDAFALHRFVTSGADTLAKVTTPPNLPGVRFWVIICLSEMQDAFSSAVQNIRAAG